MENQEEVDDVMIDIETKSCTHDGVVLTVGAHRFRPLGYGPSDAGFYRRLIVEEQEAAPPVGLGRTVNNATMKWWSEQHEQAYEEAHGAATAENPRIGVLQFFAELAEYLQGVNRVWAHGLSFDMAFLKDLARQAGVEVPWKFWLERDTRTLFDVAQVAMPAGVEGKYHHALEDCKRQLATTQYAFRVLAERA